MNSIAMVAECDGLTYRKLDYWCHHGIFGDRQLPEGRAKRREFDDQDLHVARVLARVSVAFERLTGTRGACIGLYTELARQLREGVQSLDVQLERGIVFSVDVAEVLS